jgi:hypothetical protein
MDVFVDLLLHTVKSAFFLLGLVHLVLVLLADTMGVLSALGWVGPEPEKVVNNMPSKVKGKTAGQGRSRDLPCPAVFHCFSKMIPSFF